MPIHRMCYDKILPRDLYLAHEVVRLPTPTGETRVRALMPRGKKWPTGSTLRVRFMGGSATQRQMVRNFAKGWTEVANLEFLFDDSPQAEIRISFDANDGAWSYIGIDCRDIPLHAATMNLGWQDEAVILHEFGHAIGLAHEHQNPAGGIEWNEDVVIRDLGGAPNFWDPETVRHNVLEKYAVDQVNGTQFDPDSIMLYAFPDSWTLNGPGTQENEKLSTLDRQFISSPVAYPGRATTTPVPEVVALTVTEVRAQAASIAKAGEQDLFSFQATKSGTYTIETEGQSDLVMKLFGPNNRAQFLSEDDDSGAGSNPRISTHLVPGTYYVQVRHYQPSGTGAYSIRVYI